MTLWMTLNRIIVASLQSEPTCKVINIIQDECLLISRLPGLALRMHIRSLKAEPGKLDIKRHSPSILYTLYIIAGFALFANL